MPDPDTRSRGGGLVGDSDTGLDDWSGIAVTLRGYGVVVASWATGLVEWSLFLGGTGGKEG